MSWSGIDRRQNSNGRREQDRAVCPLHSRTCADIAGLGEDMKKRVPNWVLSILIIILLSVLSTFMIATTTQQKTIARGVRTNEITLNEVSMNQRLVIKELGLTYQYLGRSKGE